MRRRLVAFALLALVATAITGCAKHPPRPTKSKLLLAATLDERIGEGDAKINANPDLSPEQKEALKEYVRKNPNGDVAITATTNVDRVDAWWRWTRIKILCLDH